MNQHLIRVSNLTGEFASAFGARELGRLIGLLHDFGKHNPAWQEYLWKSHLASLGIRSRPRTKVPHAIWGAAFAYQLLLKGSRDRWQEIALPILGHHTSLEDAGKAALRLNEFLHGNQDATRIMQELLRLLQADLAGGLPVVQFPAVELTQRELFIRMLYAALIDADRTDAAIQDGRAFATNDVGESLVGLWNRFALHSPRCVQQSTIVQRVRNEVYEACLAAALNQPGIFRLRVPTGGGKTRSGLAFALKHASIHDLRRVVVALPYTSIIDQVARDYRDMLGDDAVLEHHSAIEIPEREGETEATRRQQQATENWDAPVIVTTTVQLFESLFGDRASRVRKIHRLARSVIILDEVQAFPPELLRPTLDVLRWLARPVAEGGYGATVVLSTATQPAFEAGPLADLLSGIEITEVVPNYAEHYDAYRRVNFQVRPTPVTWAELAAEIREHRQVLVVLNTRKDALSLLEAIGPGEDTFHLSTLLCGAHRRVVLTEVNERLDSDRPVHLISTQVIECGVNLDFPIAYRAVGPLDRIVQVAGRCNRHGMRQTGTVVIFSPAD